MITSSVLGDLCHLQASKRALGREDATLHRRSGVLVERLGAWEVASPFFGNSWI